MTTIKLGYWGIRGRGQVPRLLLSYTGLEWENVAYTDPAQWFGNDKLNLGFDFPNLPYLIDGDLKLSESDAIERYVIEKSGKKELLGKNAHDAAKVNEVVGVFGDVRMHVVGKLFFDPEYESKVKQTWELVKPKLDFFQKFVGEKEWTLGYLTLADFIIAENSYYLEKVYPEEYKSYPALQRIRDNIENLPEIKEYYAKPNAIKGPFLPPQRASIKL